MTPTAAARLVDEVGRLWPRRVADGKDPHPWTEVAQDVYHKALCSASLDMSEEQALLAVRQLKAEGEYVPNDTGWKLLLVRLKAIANQGKGTDKPSPGSNEYQRRDPPPPGHINGKWYPGGFVTGNDFREWARANGVPVYLDGAIGKGTSK